MSGYVDTDDAMERAMLAAQREALITEGVKGYLRLVAEEHVEALGVEGMGELVGRRDALWARLSQAERDTANDLAEGIFGPWL